MHYLFIPAAEQSRNCAPTPPPPPQHLEFRGKKYMKTESQVYEISHYCKIVMEQTGDGNQSGLTT